jgi:signal transduction histidine kinase
VVVAAELPLDLPAGVELIGPGHGARLVPALARILAGAVRARRQTRSWIPACERLLATTDASALCQIVAEEVAASTDASWAAVLQVSGEARPFGVAGSVGPVPAALRDCHDMTPAELAGALGWNAQRPFAQIVQSRRSTVARGVRRGDGVAAFAVLAGTRAVRAVAVAGWSPPATHPPHALATMTAIAEIGAASLRHSSLVADLLISERTKSEFVATMSHELRNPLSAILGYTDLLVHGDFGALAEEQAEVLRRAHQSASSLLDLINATLDVSRLEVGSSAGPSGPIDLAAVVRDEIEEVSANRRRERLSLRAGAPLATVIGDSSKVRVAIRQALEASLAANPVGPIHIALERLDAGCSVEIAPEGMAEPGERAPVIVELPEDAEAEGVPFAVFVAKRLLELIGATLAVWRDRAGDRVAFRLWLPDQISDNGATSPL